MSGVSPARSSARLLTDLNVEPGAYCPNVARFWPPLPGPLAAASDRAVARPDRHQRAGRADVGEQPLRLGLEARRPWSARATCPAAASSRNSSVSVPSSSTAWTTMPVGAAQLLVVPRLQAGQPRLVAHLVEVGVLLDHLRGDVADRAEDRRRELAGRRQRQLAVDEQHPGRAVERASTAGGTSSAR